MLCPSCHTELKHCPCCGAHLQNTGSSTTIEAEIILSDPTADEQVLFTITKENNVVGRQDPNRGISPDIDLSSLDARASVSRRHARFYCKEGSFFLEDLNSLNGTYIIEGEKESRISPKKPYPVRNGSKIRFGLITGVVEISGK